MCQVSVKIIEKILLRYKKKKKTTVKYHDDLIRILPLVSGSMTLVLTHTLLFISNKIFCNDVTWIIKILWKIKGN